MQKNYKRILPGFMAAITLTSCDNQVCKTDELHLSSGTIYFHDLTWRQGWDDNNCVFVSTDSNCSLDSSTLIFNAHSYGRFHFFERNDSLIIVSPAISDVSLLKSNVPVKLEKVLVSKYIEMIDTLQFFGYYKTHFE